MSCQCFQVGGPFIAEDPNCPLHGREAQLREEEQDSELEDLKREIRQLKVKQESLEKRIVELEN